MTAIKEAETAKWASLQAAANMEAAQQAAVAAERAARRERERAARAGDRAAAVAAWEAARSSRSSAAVAEHRRRVAGMAQDATAQALRQLTACTSLDLSRQVLDWQTHILSADPSTRRCSSCWHVGHPRKPPTE